MAGANDRGNSGCRRRGGGAHFFRLFFPMPRESTEMARGHSGWGAQSQRAAKFSGCPKRVDIY